jgi:hypothetical protein
LHILWPHLAFPFSFSKKEDAAYYLLLRVVDNKKPYNGCGL